MNFTSVNKWEKQNHFTQYICFAVMFEKSHIVADKIPYAVKLWATIGYGFS